MALSRWCSRTWSCSATSRIWPSGRTRRRTTGGCQHTWGSGSRPPRPSSSQFPRASSSSPEWSWCHGDHSKPGSATREMVIYYQTPLCAAGGAPDSASCLTRGAGCRCSPGGRTTRLRAVLRPPVPHCWAPLPQSPCGRSCSLPRSRLPRRSAPRLWPRPRRAPSAPGSGPAATSSRCSARTSSGSRTRGAPSAPGPGPSARTRSRSRPRGTAAPRADPWAARGHPPTRRRRPVRRCRAATSLSSSTLSRLKNRTPKFRAIKRVYKNRKSQLCWKKTWTKYKTKSQLCWKSKPGQKTTLSRSIRTRQETIWHKTQVDTGLKYMRKWWTGGHNQGWSRQSH